MKKTEKPEPIDDSVALTHGIIKLLNDHSRHPQCALSAMTALLVSTAQFIKAIASEEHTTRELCDGFCEQLQHTIKIKE